MLRLNTSVGIINILFWIFTELFIVLMTFQATRLLGRYILHRSFARGDKLQLNTNRSFVDTLPYNSDLQPLRPRAKLFLTAIRLFGIIISVYLGLTLDGEVRHVPPPMFLKKTGLATPSDRTLTENDGNDIAAMAKLSCLRIENNSHVDLYRGFMNTHEILCEDGHHTFSSTQLLSVDIRPTYQDHRRLDMTRINLYKQATGVEGVQTFPSLITYETEDLGRVNIYLHNVQQGDRDCYFGFERIKGQGFEQDVYLQVNASCNVIIGDFKRLLKPKPDFMPPRMSFLHQLIDAMVVWRHATEEPEMVGTDVVATITTPGSIVALLTAVVTTILTVVMWVLLRRENVKQDVLSAKGVARLWGEDKYGSSAKLFLALEGGEGPYLGSLDGLGMKGGATGCADGADGTSGWTCGSNGSDSGIGVKSLWMSCSNVSTSGADSPSMGGSSTRARSDEVSISDDEDDNDVDDADDVRERRRREREHDDSSD